MGLPVRVMCTSEMVRRCSALLAILGAVDRTAVGREAILACVGCAIPGGWAASQSIDVDGGRLRASLRSIPIRPRRRPPAEKPPSPAWTHSARLGRAQAKARANQTLRFDEDCSGAEGTEVHTIYKVLEQDLLWCSTLSVIPSRTPRVGLRRSGCQLKCCQSTIRSVHRYDCFYFFRKKQVCRASVHAAC